MLSLDSDDEVDDFDADLCDAVFDWFKFNENANEVDEYYRLRLAQGSLLGPVERAIARFVASRFATSKTVCEVGAGYGQLSLLLAAAGYRVIAFEADWRFHGAQFVASTLSLMDRVELVEGWFPESLGSRDYDLLAASNVVNSGWATITKDDEGLRRALRCKPAVIDTQAWGRHRDAVEREALVDSICSVGYAAEVVWSTVVHFHPREGGV